MKHIVDTLLPTFSIPPKILNLPQLLLECLEQIQVSLFCKYWGVKLLCRY